MKKLLLTIAAIAALTAVHAQEETTTTEGFKKGDTFITGNVSYAVRKDNSSKTDYWSVSPTAGYMITDNLALGVTLGYNGQKDEYDAPGNDYKTSSVTGGIFSRYYLTPANKFSFFGEVSAQYIHTKNESSNYYYLIDGTVVSEYTENKANGYGVSAGPGISYFISPNFSLQSYVGFLTYTSMKDDSSGSTRSNNLYAGLDLANVSFGLLYKF